MDVCGPCKYRNEDTRATKYCLTCQESQCKACADIHGSSKATRNHLLLPVDDVKKNSKTTEDIEKFQNCSVHSEKKLEFYCTDHDHLMCCNCLLNVRKLDCKAIVDIETAGEQLVTCTFIEQLSKDLERVATHSKEEEEKIQKLIENSCTEKEELQKDIDNCKQKILAQFNKCEKNILDIVDIKVKAQVTELKNQQTVIRETLQTAEENKQILQTIIRNNSKADIFRCSLSIIQQLKGYQSNRANVTTDIFSHSVKLSPAFDTLIASMDSNPIMQCGTVTDSKITSSTVNLKTDKNSLIATATKVALHREKDITHDYVCSSADAETEDSDTKHNSNPSNESDKQPADSQSAQAKTSLHSTISKTSYDSEGLHISDITVTTLDDRQPFISGIVTLYDGCVVLSDSILPRLIRLKADLT